jgi:hypothetical protein
MPVVDSELDAVVTTRSPSLTVANDLPYHHPECCGAALVESSKSAGDALHTALKWIQRARVPTCASLSCSVLHYKFKISSTTCRGCHLRVWLMVSRPRLRPLRRTRGLAPSPKAAQPGEQDPPGIAHHGAAHAPHRCPAVRHRMKREASQRPGRLTWPRASRIPHLWRCCWASAA